MLALEEILCELNGEDMNDHGGLPPGFRFHPTDEELITFYLASKVFNGTFCGIDIAEVDLNRCEPWELPDVAKMGEREWYFFSLRDRKYPTGLRTNRATGSGYWKATGKDRSVYSSSGRNGALLGMKKTLVFYKGRAPRGEKTKWVMHEYRLDGDFSCRHTCKEEWVICRIFHKMGEKKNGVVLLQGQSSSSYMQEGSSSSPTINSLPPLLESNPKTGLLELKSKNHSPDQMNQNQESDLKSLINNNSSVGLTAVSQAYPININGYSYYGLKEQEAATVIKQCKTEPNLSQFQFSDANNILRWPTADSNKMYYPNPVLSFGPMDTSPDVSLMASGAFLSTAAADGTTSVVHDMSTSLSSSEVLTLNKAAGFQQMMVDPAAIKIAAVESWPFHF